MNGNARHRLRRLIGEIRERDARSTRRGRIRPRRGDLTALLAIPALLLGVTAACSGAAISATSPMLSTGASVPSTSPPPKPPSGGPLPPELIGRWVGVSPSNEGRVWDLRRTTFFGHSGGAHGRVVVDHNDISFFDADVCGLSLPDGVGTYRWRIVGDRLSLKPVNDDPCPRSQYLANGTFEKKG
jgi:hypothetical protein